MNKLVINYHLTEYCNYACQFCFAKYGLEDRFNSELHHDLEKVNSLFEQLWSRFGGSFGPRINFVGGEPLLVKNFDEIISRAVSRGFEVSFVTNGSALTEGFLSTNANKMSMIGVSVDSFLDSTNRTIGRSTSGSKLLDQDRLLMLLDYVRSLNPKIQLKINTVVCAANFKENMCDGINRIQPDKWKIFRVLPEGDRRKLLITDNDFALFVARHKGNVKAAIFVEDNDAMTESYIMIDPLGRFMQNSGPQGSRVFSQPILDVGARQAFSEIKVRKEKYDDRYIPVQTISLFNESDTTVTEKAIGCAA